MDTHCPKSIFFFLAKWLWPLLPIYCASWCQKTSKKSEENESWDIRLLSFGPNWVQIVKREFLGKIDQCYLCQSIEFYHSIVFHKKICHRSWDKKLTHSRPNWTQTLAWKGDFLGKFTNATCVYLFCPTTLQSRKKYLDRTDQEI